MEWILALDIGEKRVGTALMKPGVQNPLPHRTFVRDNDTAEAAILELIRERPVELLVVGTPLNEDGSRSAQCDNIERFVRRIVRRAKVNVQYVDEYGTSADAEERLGLSSEHSVRTARDSGRIDSMAAVIILEMYLRNEKGI